MSSSWLYRIASALLVLFAIGHTLGFSRTNIEGAESVAALMRTVHFAVQGSRRSYWDFYIGFGLFVTVFLLFAAILSWELGGLTRETLQLVPAVTWGLAVCFLAVTVLSWMYFFPVPGIFSTLITLCLVLAAWLPGRPR